MPQPTAKQFSGIFVSYRRDDSSGHAGRLFDRLTAHFGEDQIFMDIDQIEPGEDFVQVIEDAVGSCDILLALIGRNWLASRDDAGRRLDNSKDFVRLEIAAALTRGIRVIPVLVQGAQMPRPQDLPEDLLPLSRRQALELSDLRWRHDVDQLIVTLEKTLTRQREARQRTAQEETERQHREAEAQRQAEEEERKARLTRVIAYAEAKKEATKRETVTVQDVPLTIRPEVKPASAAKSWRSIVQPRWTSPTTMIIFTSLALLLFLVSTAYLKWQLELLSGGKTPSTEPSPSATEHLNEKYTSSQSMSEPQVPPKMVYVRGGEFLMGSDAGEYEKPAHTVVVKPFFIDQYEVTNEEYAKFVKETKHKPPQTWDKGAYSDGAAHHPVTGVTWDDANDYAKWAGKRLPTEEEWEFAARGTDGRRYPWGKEWRAGLANADGASVSLVDVGSYQGKSPFEASDMVGNAWEWTASRLTAYPGGRRPPQQSPGDWRVIRGGSYLEDQNEATTTYRRGYPARGNYDYGNTGFRCAKDAANSPGQN